MKEIEKYMKDTIWSEISNKLFPDELTLLKRNTCLEPALDTRLNIKHKEILIVSTPKETLK